MRRRPLRSHRLAIAVTGSLSTGALLCPQVHAQANDPVVKEGEAQPAPKQKGERIQITGSRIKRTQVEGVAPVVKVDEEAIQKSGTSTVGELLQNMTISMDGSYSSSTVNDTRGTVTNVNLRGLGPENTLVLLDGRRMPDEGGEGVIDLSTIPISAIERIEVLKDSASAIYGSDATGGVINVITKKDFDGSAFYVRGATPSGKGGDQTMFSYLTGVTKDNFRSMTALSYRHSDPVYYRDRDWTKDAPSIYAFPANISGQGIPLQQHPNCPDSTERIDADGQAVCAYNYGQTSAFSPETTEVSILNNFDYQINSKVGLYSSIRAVHNTNKWNMAPNAGKFTIPAAVVALKRDELKLSQLNLTAAPNGDVDAYYRSTLWGLRTWNEENTVIGGNIGLKGEISDTWSWDISAGRTDGKKDSINPTGFMLKDEMVNAIRSGEFNPFEADISNPALTAVVDRSSYQPFVVTETQMLTYDASVSGELFDLPGGSAGLAVGLSRWEQDYSKLIDEQSQNDNVFGVTNDQGDRGSREVNAVYAELALPVRNDLDMQLAVRHDEYSDFGGTTNPKFGFKYLPVPEVLVRGSVATGFKAPTLKEIHKGRQVRYANVKDKQRFGDSEAVEPTDEVEIETTGNKDLKEETSLSYNIGLVAEPVDNVTLSADYWTIEIDNKVTDMDAQDVMDSIVRGNSVEGVEFTRAGGAADGRLERMRLPTLNLGKSEDAGYDLGAEYRFRTGANRVSVGSDYSRKVYSRQVPFPGLPQRNTVGDRGRPAWKMVNNANWNVGNHGFLVRNNIIAEQRSNLDPDLNIGSFTTYDVQYSWTHPWNGSVAVGALNVLDTEFPFDNSEREGDDRRVKELYNADGRLLYVNLNQTF